ncbi:hypothetical protein BHM03_00034745 [Ensete ventricosum]|nr:hypothetical protein BHM03_00034745 [Ensete ventricosum]
MAAITTKLKTSWSRLLSFRPPPRIHLLPPFSIPQPFPTHTTPYAFRSVRPFSTNPVMGDRVVQGLLAEVEREKQKAREERRKAGVALDGEDEDEEEEDYMGVTPLIEKLEKKKAKDLDSIDRLWVPTDSESDDDERFSPDEVKKRVDEFEKKCKRHAELLKNFAEAGTSLAFLNLYQHIDQLSVQCVLSIPTYGRLRYPIVPSIPVLCRIGLKPRLAISIFTARYGRYIPVRRVVDTQTACYRAVPPKIDRWRSISVVDGRLKGEIDYRRVIGDLMNRLKESTGKERFILLQKLNRAVRLMDCKEAYDPNNPANFGVIQHRQVASPDDIVDSAGFDKEKSMIHGASLEEDDEDFSERKEQDDILIEKLNAIEKKLEEKLAELDHTFGKKSRVLEEEIKDLVEERNSLTAKKRRPLYRKGGQVAKFRALLATGNYHGVVGFAKAKGPNAKIAIQRVSSRTVETVLYLAGFSNVKSKIIGSRNPLNVIKTLFKALNAVSWISPNHARLDFSVFVYELLIETPKDVQEKFGRTVVETYLL